MELAIEAAAPPKDPRGSRVLLEAKVVWGGETVAVNHLRIGPRRWVRVRDLGIGLALDVGRDLVVARVSRRGGDAELVLPSGETASPGSRVALRLGDSLLVLSLVDADVAAPPRSRGDGRMALALLGAFALHVGLLGLFVYGRASSAAMEQSSLATMQRYVASADARARLSLSGLEAGADAPDATAPSTATPANRHPGASTRRSRTPEGGAGSAVRATTEGRRRATRGEERPGEGEIASFGILSLIADDPARSGDSAFGAETGRSAIGALFGTSIGDAVGTAGIALSSTGEGGGGRGAGVSLAGVGTIGFGVVSGIGAGSGRLGGSHEARSPVMRCDSPCKMLVTGRIPPETVQRIVRENFGRLRLCYEQGLLHAPDLEGRIAVKFVIDRDGAVAMVSAAESSVADDGVVRCVERAFSSMSFPAPAGGIVTVVYPIVFERS